MKNGPPVILEINFQDSEEQYAPAAKVLRVSLVAKELFFDIRTRDENFTTTTDRSIATIKVDVRSFRAGLDCLEYDQEVSKIA